MSGRATLGNVDAVRYRKGVPVNPMEITYNMRLIPEEHAYAIAKKYGINLKGLEKNNNCLYTMAVRKIELSMNLK